jgi:drug/metabolite transporter (DMT)-like permease
MMKLAVSEMEPMHFRTLCLFFGAISLLAIGRLKGLPIRVPKGQWLRVVVISLANLTGWSVLSIYGIRLMASGRAAILGYTMPAWSVFLSAWLLKEPLTKRRGLGVMLGMAGMGLLMGNEIYAVGRSPIGSLLMAGAALSWALGTVIMKRWPVELSSIVFAGWQMVIAGIPIFITALFWESGHFNPFSLSWGPRIGVFYNLFVAFIFCYWAWTKIAVTVPVGVSSLAVMMIPVVGVFSGVVVLDETPRWLDFVALAAVVGSLATVMLPPRKKESATPSA